MMMNNCANTRIWVVCQMQMFYLTFDVAGPKGRSYVLMLLRMNKLVIENVDGSASYRVLL